MSPCSLQLAACNINRMWHSCRCSFRIFISHNTSYMDYINSLSATQVTIAATSLVVILTAVAMGLFGKNQMPVEGKVR